MSKKEKFKKDKGERKVAKQEVRERYSKYKTGNSKFDEIVNTSIGLAMQIHKLCPDCDYKDAALFQLEDVIEQAKNSFRN